MPLSTTVPESPIYLAVRRGDDATVVVILSWGQISSHRTEAFAKAASHSLTYAASRGSTNLVKILLGCDAIDPNRKYTWRGRTPLHYAAVRGDLQMAEILLDHREINVNSSDSTGHTPLHVAARQGNSEMVEILLGHHDILVNIKSLYCDDGTPLHFAGEDGHINVIKLLLAHKDIDTGCKDRNGRTSLTTAFFKHRWSALRLIAEHVGLALNIETKFTEGKIPITHLDQYWSLIDHLLGHRLLHMVDIAWRGLIKDGIESGVLEVVKLLSDRLNFDVNTVLTVEFNGGFTALHIATEYHRHDILRYYLDDPRTEVNMKVSGFKRESVLHIAVNHNCMTAVKLLPARPEIDLTLRNMHGKSALDYALMLKEREMLELLLKHGAVGDSLEMSPTIVIPHANEQSCWTLDDEEQPQLLKVQSSSVEMEHDHTNYDYEEYGDDSMIP
jgi:ankyrin repeat protein